MKIWIFNSYYEKYDDINDYGSDNITGITITLKLSATVIPWSDTYTSVILSSFTYQLQNPPVCNICVHGSPEERNSVTPVCVTAQSSWWKSFIV